MIVPDKKTETFLNKTAKAEDIISLCHEGILPSADFLKALALCRSEKKWQNGIRLALLCLVCLWFCSAFFFFVLSGWSFFYTLNGGILLAILFIVCCCFRRFAIADYVGAFVIGVMIFLPDMVFGTNTFLYKQFFLYFVLLIFWAVPSKRTGIRLLPFIVLNVSIAMYGIQFLLPSFRTDVSSFCALAALLNAGLLILREETVDRITWFRNTAFRLFLLMAGCVFLLAGAIMRENSVSQELPFLYCLFFAVILSAFYFFKDRERTVFCALLVFCALWGSLLLYGYIKNLELSFQTGRALFLTGESLIVMTVWIAGNKLNDCLKEKKNVC